MARKTTLKPEPEKLSRWSVFHAGSTPARWLGWVDAKDADSARAAAAKEFKKTAAKLVVVRRAR
jgi:hypothetical protein